LGSEAVCSVRYAGQTSEGKALLETSEVIFRSGEFRLRIPFAEMNAVVAEGGELRLGYNGDIAVFELGREAEKWAEKIKNPRGLMEKLGVKAGMRLVVLGVEDPAFLSKLEERFGAPEMSPGDGDADMVFYEADRLGDLARLTELRAAIKPAGAVWVVSPKGKSMLEVHEGERVRDVDVMAAAREAGLVDTKVVAFSGTHTALKLVIPKARRQPAR
jgi:hypothetical protein